MALLKRGLRGAPVVILQEKLGLEADGIFGGGTDKALRDYQSSNGLAVDGIAGPETFMHMGLYELVLLQVGSRGPSVKRLQEALGTGADGIFGKGTEKALMDFQTANGLEADGMAGPSTLAKMDLFEEMTPEVVEKTVLKSGFSLPEIPAIFKSEAKEEDKVVELPEPVAKAQKSKGLWGSITSIFG